MCFLLFCVQLSWVLNETSHFFCAQMESQLKSFLKVEAEDLGVRLYSDLRFNTLYFKLLCVRCWRHFSLILNSKILDVLFCSISSLCFSWTNNHFQNCFLTFQPSRPHLLVMEAEAGAWSLGERAHPHQRSPSQDSNSKLFHWSSSKSFRTLCWQRQSLLAHLLYLSVMFPPLLPLLPGWRMEATFAKAPNTNSLQMAKTASWTLLMCSSLMLVNTHACSRMLERKYRAQPSSLLKVCSSLDH